MTALLSILSIAFLFYLAIFLLIPLVMLITGKVLGVANDKLKYSSLLLITFVGSLLGGFVRELHPYALISVFFVLVLWMIKKQLGTSWGKAFAMTLSGLIIGGALTYMIPYLGIKTVSTAYDSEREMMASSKIEVGKAPKPKLTLEECLNIGKEKVASYPIKKLDSIIFNKEPMRTGNYSSTGDGYSDNCMVTFLPNESEYFIIHVVNNKVKSYTQKTFGDSIQKFIDIDNLKILDSTAILEKLKNDTEFKTSLNEFLESHPALTEKEAIRLHGIEFDSVKFNKYVWIVSIGVLQIFNSEIETEYTLDAITGEILNREKSKGFSEKWEYINGEWINTKDNTEVKPNRPKLPIQ